MNSQSTYPKFSSAYSFQLTNNEHIPTPEEKKQMKRIAKQQDALHQRETEFSDVEPFDTDRYFVGSWSYRVYTGSTAQALHAANDSAKQSAIINNTPVSDYFVWTGKQAI